MGKPSIAAILLALLPDPAMAGVLYKSVAPDGTLMFSDVPPPPGARILEQRSMPEGSAPEAGLPRVIAGARPHDLDAAIVRANEQVDLAERALALARRGLSSPREGLTLETRRMTPADEERVRFYKRNVEVARHYLRELMRERQLALASR